MFFSRLNVIGICRKEIVLTVENIVLVVLRERKFFGKYIVKPQL